MNFNKAITVYNLLISHSWWFFEKNDIVLNLLPLYHVFGFFVSLVSFSLALPVICVPPFDISGVLLAVQHHKVYRKMLFDSHKVVRGLKGK